MSADWGDLTVTPTVTQSGDDVDVTITTDFSIPGDVASGTRGDGSGRRVVGNLAGCHRY